MSAAASQGFVSKTLGYNKISYINCMQVQLGSISGDCTLLVATLLIARSTDSAGGFTIVFFRAKILNTYKMVNFVW